VAYRPPSRLFMFIYHLKAHHMQTERGGKNIEDITNCENDCEIM
jgi:hypothetical protein